jgi:NitT/TauT family transport system permease protein
VPALDDSVIATDEVEREDTAAVGAGLDVLEEPERVRDPWWRRLGTSIVPPILAMLLVLVVWEIVYLLHLKPEVMLPSPAAVFDELGRLLHTGQAWETIWTSLSRGLFGFAMAIVLAVPIGLAIARFGWLRSSVGPLLSGLQSMPSVAWVPLAILWFQISPAMIYMVVLLGAVPSIANGLIAGIDQVPPLYTRVGKVLGLSWWGQARHVLVPAALPGFLAGLRQGWAFSWRSLMAAELIVTSSKLGFGLGQLMNQGRDLSDAPMLYAGLILIFVVGVGVELILFRPLERAILDARGLSTSKRR